MNRQGTYGIEKVGWRGMIAGGRLGKVKEVMMMMMMMMMMSTTMASLGSSSSSSSSPLHNFSQPAENASQPLPLPPSPSPYSCFSSSGAASCLYDPTASGSYPQPPTVSAAACPCPPSPDISGSFFLAPGVGNAEWKTRRATGTGDRLVMTMSLEGPARDEVEMIQLQLRHALELLVIKEFLTSPDLLSSHARCVSFTYEHALPGTYLISATLFSLNNSKAQPVMLFSSHHNFEVETPLLPSPQSGISLEEDLSKKIASSLAAVTVRGRDLEFPLHLGRAAPDSLLLLVAATETTSLTISKRIWLLRGDNRLAFNVSLSLPPGVEYSMLIALTPFKEEELSTQDPLLEVRKFLHTSRCQDMTCSLADHLFFSPPQVSPAPTPTSASAADSVVPHPEDLLCSIYLSILPGERVHALQTVTVAVFVVGLSPSSRYKIVLLISLQDVGRVIFEKSTVMRGDALQPIQQEISSFWPGEFVVQATLYDDNAQEEVDEAILAKFSKRLVSVASCEVSYLWSSSHRPLFHGSLPYKDSPFAGLGVASDSPPQPQLPVTLATCTTVDRAVVLINAAAHWQEDMAVAFYARSQSDEEQIRSFVKDSLGPWFSSRGRGLEVVMLTLCHDRDSESRFAVFPINMLRKISCAIAKSDLVLYSDVDMIPSDSLADRIRRLHQTSSVGSRQLLVVPSFKGEGAWPPHAHMELHNKSLQVRTHAVSLQDLMASFQACHVNIPALPCGLWSPSYRWSEAGVYHAPSEYGSWFDAHEPYEVDYIVGYEPYVVVNRSSWLGKHGAGLYDDGYVTWGWDKSSFTWEAAVLGYSFLVLPKGFLVHASSQFKHRQLSVRLFSMGRQVYPGWGPPDTRGRRRFHEAVFAREVPVQHKVRIRSHLIPALNADACSMAGLRLVVSEHLEEGEGGHLLRLEGHGLCESVGYQVSVNVLRASDRMPLKTISSQHVLLPHQLTGSSKLMLLQLGRLPAGKFVLKIELQDLQAAKVLERSGRATLEWTERVYEIVSDASD
eukprot:768538-Hanusia_phi.AAC.4